LGGDGAYAFYTIAYDKAGNVEAAPLSPDATTTLVTHAPSNTRQPSIPSTGKVGTRVTCKPGAWTGAPSSFTFTWTFDGSIIAGQHGSTYTLAAGDVTHKIRCLVVAHNRLGDSRVVSSNALTVAKPASACNDKVPPESTIDKRGLSLKNSTLKLQGTASDAPCKGKPGRVVRVFVTVSRHVNDHCRFLLEDGRHFGPIRKCDGAPPIVFPAKGTSQWSLKMPAVLPAGSYTIRSRATDAAGNVQAVRGPGPNVILLRLK
jgi:hypothetical protein